MYSINGVYMEDKLSKYLSVKNIVFCVIAILFLIFLNTIKDIAIMFFASFVIACSLEPIVKFFEAKTGRKNAAAIVMVLLIGIICLLTIPLFFVAGNQIRNFIEAAPVHLATLKGIFTTIPFLNKQALNQIDLSELVSSASGVTGNVFSETVSIGKNISSGFVYLIVSFIIIFYLIADKQTVKSAVLRLIPSDLREKSASIYDNIAEKVGGYVIAQIVTMLSVGLIMAVGLSLLHVEYAILLGLITSILDIVPVIGPAFALIIALIVSYKSGTLALFGIIAVFGVAQLAQNNFIRPYVFSRFLDLHPLIIYFFLFLMAKFLGITGVIFAPAIAATVVVLIEEIYIKNIE